MVDYDKYIASPEWDDKRRQILARAGGCCERCGCKAPLAVHHLHYETLGDEDLGDLEALCEDCHTVADSEREQETQARRDEWEEERWDSRVEGWADARYGPGWRDQHSEADVAAAFIEWLEVIGDDSDIPEWARPRPLWSEKTPVQPEPPAYQPSSVPMRPGTPAPDNVITLSRIADFEQCPFKYFKTHVEVPREQPPYQTMRLAFASFYRRYINTLLHREGTRIADGFTVDAGLLQAAFVKQYFDGESPITGVRLARLERRHNYEDRIKELTTNLNNLISKRLSGKTCVAGFNWVEFQHASHLFRTNVDLVTKDANGAYEIWIWKTGQVGRDTRDVEARCHLAWQWGHQRFDTEKITTNAVFLTKRDYVLRPSTREGDVTYTLNWLLHRHEALGEVEDYCPRTSKLCDWCTWQSRCPAQ